MAPTQVEDMVNGSLAAAEESIRGVMEAQAAQVEEAVTSLQAEHAGVQVST
jgi:hypothetical protein